MAALAATRALRHPVTILCLLVAAFFYKEIFLGRVFSPADQLLTQNPWQAYRPPTFTVASNPLRSDETLINFPHRFDIATDVKQFTFTLWQDHTLAGSRETFSLHYLAGWIYLPMLAFLVFPAGLANTILHMTIPLYAGLAMYLFASLLSQNRWARLFGAVAFALNGYSTVWLSSFVLPVIVATLPLILYLAIRFLRDGRMLHGALFGVATGAILFFAYPPAVIIVALITGVFVLTYWLADRAARSFPLLRLVGLGVLGLGLGLAALLPTISDLSNFASKTYHGPPGPMPLRFLAAFVFPNIAGNPIAQDWQTVGNYCEYVAYNGSLPFMLAGTGVILMAWTRRAAPLALAAVVTGILSFVLTYNATVVHLVGSLPVLYDLNPDRWTIGIDFSVAVLSVYTIDRLIASPASRARLVAAGVGAGLFLVATLGLLWLRRNQFLHVDDFISRDFRLRLVLVLLGAAAVVFFAYGRRLTSWAPALLVAVLAVDLFSFGVDFNPAIPGNEFYPVTPAIQYLQQHAGPYRVLPVGGAYYTDDFTVYGLDVVTGYDHFRDDRYLTLLGDSLSGDERSLWAHSGFVTIGQQPHLASPAFDMLAVKYAYFQTAPAAATVAAWGHWQQVYSGPDGAILENLQALPKQFIADSTGTTHAINHVASRPDKDTLEVDGGGTLVWSKPSSPDWKVSVDGHAVSTGTYAGYFLSIDLPPGHHTVAISYEPRVYLLGAIGSLLAALALVAVYLLSRRRQQARPR